MDLEVLATELSAARETHAYIAPPSSRLAEFSVEDGYRIGARLHAEALRDGRRQIGVKLGFTNEAAWNAFGLDSPFWSPMYADTVTEQLEVSIGSLVEPRIEPEIVVGLGLDLSLGASRRDVAAAIAWVAVGFELVQCHYRNWEMTPADAIADGGLHGTLVVGEHHDLGVAGAEALSAVEVELMRDAVIVATGVGANALGGPLEAVTWLMRLPGIGVVPAGSVITTGTLTSAFPVAAGETWSLASRGPLRLGDLSLALRES